MNFHDSKASSAIDLHKVAWAAGIIEGEGSIGAAIRAKRISQKKYIAIRVRVAMSDRDVVARLGDALGVGHVLPFKNSHGLGKKDLFLWEVSSRADVTLVCDAIYPWMGERRRSQIASLRELLASHPPVSPSQRTRNGLRTRSRGAMAAPPQAAPAPDKGDAGRALIP